MTSPAPRPNAPQGIAEIAADPYFRAVLENTVVRDWVERFGEQEAVERAGLRSTASLRTR